jgi:hypothetical protein
LNGWEKGNKHVNLWCTVLNISLCIAVTETPADDKYVRTSWLLEFEKHPICLVEMV